MQKSRVMRRYFPTLLFSHAALQDEDVLGNTCKLGCEILEMLSPASQKQWAPSRFYGAHDVVGDHLVTRDIIHERGVDVLNRNISEVGRHPELRVARSHLVLEGCRSFRVGVAVKPTTYLAFTCLITCSKVKADMWWHSSTITWPYSATKSFTSSFRYRLWMTATSTQPVRSIFPPPICPIDLAGKSKNIARCNGSQFSPA